MLEADPMPNQAGNYYKRVQFRQVRRELFTNLARIIISSNCRASLAVSLLLIKAASGIVTIFIFESRCSIPSALIRYKTRKSRKILDGGLSGVSPATRSVSIESESLFVSVKMSVKSGRIKLALSHLAQVASREFCDRQLCSFRSRTA
jgi:hypothetical protein